MRWPAEAALAAALVLAPAAHGQEEAPAAAPEPEPAAEAREPALPEIAVPEGAESTFSEGPALDVYAAPLRTADAEAPMTQPVEGEVTWRAWRTEAGSSLAAVRAVTRPLTEAGWETVLDCRDEACGGFDFRRALSVAPLPAMRLSVFDFHQTTLRRDDDLVSVLASETDDAVWLQVVVVTGARPVTVAEAAPDLLAPAPDAEPTTFDGGAEAAAPEISAAPDGQQAPPDPPTVGAPVAATADDVLRALDGSGRVVLENVDFRPGSAELAEGGAQALDAAVEALRRRPELSVVVVGHTDATGPLDVNRRIAAERAGSVVDALVERGVARGRLQAEGAGWLAPRASNATPEGRALNRRVELVVR